MLRAGLYKKSTLSFIFLICIAVIPIYTQTPGGQYFIAYGKLLKINYVNKSISVAGSFHRTAKYYAVARDGAVWSRKDYTHIEGVYPDRAGEGRAQASIRLPFRPYRITILPDGTGYISHQILTAKGFPLSVVDTDRKVLVQVFYHIEGLVTDLLNSHGAGYLTTYGFRKPHTLRIYRIRKGEGSAEEIYSSKSEGSESEGHVLKLSPFKNTLYVTLVPGRTSALEPEIKQIDLSGKVIAVCKGTRMRGISRILDKPYFYNGNGYLPCKTQSGKEGFAVFSVKKQSVVDVLPVQSSIYKIIGVRSGMIAYINIQPDVGKGELAIYFYSIKGRKEVRNIKILPVILHTAENKN